MENISPTTARKPWTKPTLEILQARMAAGAPAVTPVAPRPSND